MLISDGSTRWSLCLPLKINLGPAYANGFIAVFADQSSPGKSSLELVTMTLPFLGREGTTALEEKPMSELFLHPGLLKNPGPTLFTNQNLVLMEVSCCKKWTTAVTLDAASTSSGILKV